MRSADSALFCLIANVASLLTFSGSRTVTDASVQPWTNSSEIILRQRLTGSWLMKHECQPNGAWPPLDGVSTTSLFYFPKSLCAENV